MNKSISLLIAAVLCAAAAVICSPAQAAGAPGPPPPENRVTAPDIAGVNPDVALSEGYQGDIPPSGIVSSPAVDPPAFVAVSQPAAAGSRPRTDPLAVPLRTQDPADVTCGAAALGMALDRAALTAGGDAPTTAELIAGLRSSGLLYEGVGTGAEELAYLARQHGFRGSWAFHGWTLGGAENPARSGPGPGGGPGGQRGGAAGPLRDRDRDQRGRGLGDLPRSCPGQGHRIRCRFPAAVGSAGEQRDGGAPEAALPGG